MKKLIIVESPNKCKTISQYLGDDFIILSSVGHIRDLATSGQFGFGVDPEDNFKPTYKTIKGKSKVITDLKKELKKVDKVYLATDPDREGEAIAWHLFEALGLSEDQYERITFNELTKNTILSSFDNAGKIDMYRVHSQETRRILDRIIGFRLSKLMQSKTGGKSAGRVQSVALKLIVDREREIEAFVPVEYWSITAKFNEFEANLVKFKGKKVELPNEFETKQVLDKLSKSFTIDNVETKTKNKKSPMPFITSTMQQRAASKFGYNAKKTMMIAQKLYEGVKVGNKQTGLITYMRTDSYRLADEFVNDTLAFIKGKYGPDYVGSRKVVKKKDNVQDAHEAIRPTDIKITPASVEKCLTPEQFKLYSLIYAKTIASLMANAKVNATTIYLLNNEYEFTATGQVLVFDGYLKEYHPYEDNKDKLLPDVASYKANVLPANDIVSEQHFTKPPARFNESSLIKTMEELGIGRPSTYASIIDTLKKRVYVNVEEKRFHPTTTGIETNDKLQEAFANIINVEYTANMESDLDLIARKDKVWYEVLKEFYDQFMPQVAEAFETLEKKAPELTGEDCPKCKSNMVYKTSRYGRFEACSNYPECKHIKQQEKAPEVSICKCPNCDDGDIVEKKTRRGKAFYGCNNYPKCQTAYWYKPTGEKCTDCEGLMVEKKDGSFCPACAENNKKTKK